MGFAVQIASIWAGTCGPGLREQMRSCSSAHHPYAASRVCYHSACSVLAESVGRVPRAAALAARMQDRPLACCHVHGLDQSSSTLYHASAGMVLSSFYMIGMIILLLVAAIPAVQFVFLIFCDRVRGGTTSPSQVRCLNLTDCDTAVPTCCIARYITIDMQEVLRYSPLFDAHHMTCTDTTTAGVLERGSCVRCDYQ